MPNVLFRNHGGKYFVDVTAATGTGISRRDTASRSQTSTATARSTSSRTSAGSCQGTRTTARCQEPRARRELDPREADRRQDEPRGDRRKDHGHAGRREIRYREVSTGGSFGARRLRSISGWERDVR